ncbi:polysaccharide pyruvyl transferase CsaB [Candidatus Villigracilis affinis]|uniref:polysaccharide pyruvyl transferase CsaB n=1 Tax=Candidatus Villigracilis affinis TaxID=3140682 RepID=UPI001DB9594E|nr:polysaccharide pyruvyl transferase CsaB [Anaerolineales bacterium]
MDKNNKKTILVAGYYGFGNVGDEAILSAILTDLRKQREGLEFIVISSNPEETAASHNVRSVHWKEINALMDAARECDLIILGGGGIFQDYWGTPAGTHLTEFHWGISYYSSIGLLASLFDKPFMIYSVGIGPLLTDEGKRWTRLAFELADAATVRDVESRDLLASLGFPKKQILIKPDPALNLSPKLKAAAEILQAEGISPKERPMVGVCIRNWTEGEKGGAWKQELASALDSFLEKHNAQIVFIPFQVGEHELENDYTVSVEVISMMQNQERTKVLPQAYSPEVVEGLIARCRVVIGMRLHSLVFAASVGVPSVALIYDPKVKNLMKFLGLSDYALDLQTMNVDSLSDTFHYLWADQKQVRASLAEQGQKFKQLVQTNTTLALKLLDQKTKRIEKPVALQLIRDLAVKQTGAFFVREKEAQALTADVARLNQQVADQLARIAINEYEIDRIQKIVDYQQYQLHEMVHSTSWKIALIFQKIRTTLIPLGSRREKLVRFLFHWFFRKPRALISRIRASIRTNGVFGAILKGFVAIWVSLTYPIKKAIFKQRYERELKELETIIAGHNGFFDLFHIPMGWNTMLFQRFQHVSLQSAKLGGIAIYGGHPTVDKDIFVYKKAAENLYVFKATDPQITERILQALEKKGNSTVLRIESIDLVTTAEDVENFLRRGFRVVYEYIDEITSDITGNVPELVRDRHQALLRNEAVFVVATSDQLYEEVARHRAKNFVLSTNGVDLENWRIPKGEPPVDMKSAFTGNTIVAYHGALAKWLDYDLLRMIADEGSYELVLIGHEHDDAFEKSGLKSHPRVHFLGSKPYSQLNQYAIHYGVTILPFKKSNLTEAVSPVKIFEYMAALKPIVTTDLRECKKYKSCLTAETNEEFMLQLKRATDLRNDAEYLKVLDTEANENSWEHKTIEILNMTGVKL